MHLVTRSGDIGFTENPAWAGRSQGYTQASLIDHTTGSVHTGLSLNELAGGGMISPHVHSCEEGFYILEGEAVVAIEDRAWTLGPGDFGVFKIGTKHGWRNSRSPHDRPVRWLQMAAPQPKPEGQPRDTFFAKHSTVPADAVRFENGANGANDGGALLGHFDASQIPPPGPRRAALAGAEGVFLKWMIDEQFGARHHRMVFIEYQAEARIGLHDHTFEEAYYILSGEADADLDGRKYRVGPGDVLWTGVGCVHAFANAGTEPVRWLETFSPQPPAENVFRFMAEWERRAREIEG
jgi:quercetin dioxygenase-like cupin family protein